VTVDLASFAKVLTQNAKDKGFYDHEEWLLDEITSTVDALETVSADHARERLVTRLQHQRAQLIEHYGNRLMLMVSEAVEGHDEIRQNHGVAEVYFRRPDGTISDQPVEKGVRLKPEGLLFEIADLVIRGVETMEGILSRLSEEEDTALRKVIPEEGQFDIDSGIEVNVADVLLTKHLYNTRRAPLHGGKAF
jgi:hypothetical protein